MKLATTISLFFLCLGLNAQNLLLDSDTFNYNRTRAIILGESATITGSMIGLYQLWYKDYPRREFHSFDDSREWLQMDKVGHSMSAYALGYTNYKLLRWTGINERPSNWIGGSVGLLFLSLVEVQDAYSAQWGFSWSDMAANMGGYLFFTLQQELWKEQRITLKYSYHHSKYQQYRPELLGNRDFAATLKDYNGQTYWASLNFSSFLDKSSKFPKWLNIALGYSADGMTGGSYNPVFINSDGTALPQFERRRQFLLSPDIDLRKIPVKKQWLKDVLFVVNLLKFPAPAIEWNSSGKSSNFKAHWLYF